MELTHDQMVNKIEKLSEDNRVLIQTLQEIKAIAIGIRSYLKVLVPRDVRYEMDRILDLITRVGGKRMIANYIDVNQMSISVDGKTVYKAGKLTVDRNVSANRLLKELFKVVYIRVNGCGRSIVIFPKYGVKSCLAWNMFGGKFKVSKDFVTFEGTFKIGDITRKSFRLVKVKESNKSEDN